MSTQTAGPAAAKRRGQAIAGALAGVAVVAVLVAVFFGVRAADSGDDKAPAAQAAPTQPAEQPTAAQPEPAPAQPGPVDTPAALAKEPEVKAGTGALKKLKVVALVPGTGPAVQKGQTITANYKLVSYKTGELIDSSWQAGQPFSTAIGTGSVIQGWDQGIPGQKVGSRIQLDVPADLAYGPQRGDLRFVVDILAAQ
ncbi:MAG: FKBP-type peptidyl-prolyl cis-trans isomerase [Actinoplanes sp.]